LKNVDAFGIEAALERAVVVDACRRLVASGLATIPLARRPILFALLLPLARAFPGDVPRDDLAKEAFEAKRLNDSHRSRLRVEAGRLRRELEGLISLTATRSGYALASERPIVVLLPPSDEHDAKVALLLGDGAAWTAQAIAEHAGISTHGATCAIVKTLSSDRWVTGVSCVDGALWHATHPTETAPAELRRLGADGQVEERLTLPEGVFVSGVESDGNGGFFCGGGASGTLRLVRKTS
jgi:hypothetical protein